MTMVMNGAEVASDLPAAEPVQDAELSKSGKSIVGIIYPPPEIRNIVDKTASFVARNGTSFEARIREHEANNPKFNFLNGTDPYHAYYRQKIQDLLEGRATTESQSVVGAAAPGGAQATLPQKVQEVVRAAEMFAAPTAPPEYEFMADPTTINAFDLDLIKLTAQFVARNGRQFLTQLMTRESRNFQFDFLKPQHSNFTYFTRLVEQYSKVIMPLRSMIAEIEAEANDPQRVLDMVQTRVEWERHQQRVKEKEEAEAEKERLAFSMVDWHDFVVVQTVDFQPHETVGLPPPCTPSDVGARILAQQRYEAHKKATEAVEMEVESDDDNDDGQQKSSSNAVSPPSPSLLPPPPPPPPFPAAPPPPPPPSEHHEQFDNADATIVISTHPSKSVLHDMTTAQPIPVPPKPECVTIRKDYNPKSRKDKLKVDQKWVISPLTGEKVLADKLTEHLKFNTVDQQYFVQKERELMERQEEEAVFAMGSDISANIKAFAERRTDIFGVGSKGAEQTMIGKKLGEDTVRRVDPKTIWDGHASSIEYTMRAAQSEVTLEEQIAQIHRAQGLLVDHAEKDRIGPDPVPSSAPAAEAAKEKPAVAAPPPPASEANKPQQQPPVKHVPPPSIGMINAAGVGAYAPVVMPTSAVSLQYPYDAADLGQAKRQKLFEDTLMPEGEWLRMYQERGPITLQVQLPVVTDKPEWKLNGTKLSVELSLSEQVSALKAKIQEAVGMPASKQKLSYEGVFVKDVMTLAYYNMSNGSVIELHVKERGGRKK